MVRVNSTSFARFVMEMLLSLDSLEVVNVLDNSENCFERRSLTKKLKIKSKSFLMGKQIRQDSLIYSLFSDCFVTSSDVKTDE